MDSLVIRQDNLAGQMDDCDEEYMGRWGRRRLVRWLLVMVAVLLGCGSWVLMGGAAPTTSVRIALRRTASAGRLDDASREGNFSALALDPIETGYVDSHRCGDRHLCLVNHYYVMYTGEVYVGVPKRPFRLVFDTGSADIWLVSSAATQEVPEFVNAYDATKSTTSEVLENEPWSIHYTRGSSSGYLTRDVFQIGSLKVKRQLFAQALSWTSEFEHPLRPMDGVLGLARPPHDSAASPSVLDSFTNKRLDEDMIFSFWLHGNSDQSAPLIVLGDPDPQLFEGYIVYTEVLKGFNGLWAIQLDDFSVESKSFCGLTGCTAVLDTGSSFIGVPWDMWVVFIDRITANRRDCVVLPESNKAPKAWCKFARYTDLPVITITLNGTLFSVSPEYYMSGQDITIFPADSYGLRHTDNLFILGDSFFRSHYVVFDSKEDRVGVAVAREPARPKSSRILLYILLPLGVVVALVPIIKAHRSFHRRQRWSFNLASPK